MKRLLSLGAIFAIAAFGQQSKPPAPSAQEPPEEDEASAPKQYSFNPLQASHEVQIGNYYFKKGAFKAAERRFTEATRWNPSFAEAFLRLGETEDKLKNRDAARQAFDKYLQLAPDAKNAASIRRKLTGKR